MTVIALPNAPEGLDLEDFVAALFICAQFYIEKSVEEQNVLELDILATSYSADLPDKRLVEVKGTLPHLKDAFKVLGWMTYLKYDKGMLVVSKQPEEHDLAFLTTKCDEMNIQLIVVPDVEHAADVFEAAGFNRPEELAVEIWRFSFWVERRMIESLRKLASENPDMRAPREALSYYKLINHRVSLTSDPIERVTQLYEAYKEHPRLTAGAALELEGGEFDPVTPGNPKSIGDAIYKGQHPILHACMFLEWKARMSILKAAVDYLCHRAAEPPPEPGKIRVDFGLVDLPTSFLNGLEAIAKLPEMNRYPLFWQIFLGAWGGFILGDHEEKDIENLAAQSGIAVENVPHALSAMDLLFPLEDGWIAGTSTANYRVTKMMPWGLEGIGAFHRRVRYECEEFDELATTGRYTAHDLAKWNNYGVALLKE
ncbi:MAG: hypothetical protein WD646_01675 [Actinomycetota bacterium]